MAYLFVMRGRLDLSHRLHERILHGNADVTARVTFADLAEALEVCGLEVARRRAHGQLEHLHPAWEIGQADVNSSLEASANGRIKLPRDVGGAKDQHSLGVFPHTVHLHQ